MTLAEHIDDDVPRLVAIANLLDQAGTTVFDRASRSPDYALESFGLGIVLAHGHVSSLVPPDVSHSSTGATTPERPPQELLTTAVGLSRTLPLDFGEGDAVPDLVLELCSLVREARSLDW